jgi:DnaJ-class molecular chaperone
MRDPYEVLGVDKTADAKTIKQAYRKLARQLHPDLHPGDPQAEERFKAVAAAYDFLSDADKKARYDRGEIDATGAPRVERTFYRTYAEGGPGSRYSDPRDFLRDFEGIDIFADLFGVGGRRGEGMRGATMRGTDVRHTLEIDFLDAVNGAVRELVLPGGKHLKVTIPAGSATGDVLRLRGQGAAGRAGGPAGDVHIELKVRPHPVFTRSGGDIYADLPVTLGEAVLGAKVEAPTVDGTVSLTIPPGSNTGTRLRIRGKGVPSSTGKGRGDHYVTLKVILPEKPDAELTRLIREWEARHPYRVRSGD